MSFDIMNLHNSLTTILVLKCCVLVLKSCDMKHSFRPLCSEDTQTLDCVYMELSIPVMIESLKYLIFVFGPVNIMFRN